MRGEYDISFDQFEKDDMLDKLGHSWEVEQDYYDWDRAVSEIGRFREVLKMLG